DLSAVANQGGATPGSASRLESIERIDVGGGGDNVVRITAQDVIDIAGMNLVNSTTKAALGWANGTYSFAATEARHQLIVQGDAGDTAFLVGGNWTNAGTVVQNGDTYTVYNSDSALA